MENAIGLRENEHPSFHTQDIVQGADIGINARLGNTHRTKVIAGSTARKDSA